MHVSNPVRDALRGGLRSEQDSTLPTPWGTTRLTKEAQLWRVCSTFWSDRGGKAHPQAETIPGAQARCEAVLQKFAGVRGASPRADEEARRHGAVRGMRDGLESQVHLHPVPGQPWAPPGTDLVEDVEVPLAGGLAGYSSFL